jgi:hypothetical protein
MPKPTSGPRKLGFHAAFVGCLLLLNTSAQAQKTPGQRCIEQYNAVTKTTHLDPANAVHVARGCEFVATFLAADWPSTALFGPVPAVDPRDLSATRDQTTTAPGDVAAPIEPVEAAGGSVAAVGTDKGAGAVAAIAINPSIFFLDPANTEQVARWSRFSDVTLLVPASDLEDDEESGGEANGGGTDYVGLRWGVNLTGLQQGSTLYDSVKTAYARFLEGQRVQNLQIQRLLTAAATDVDLNRCIVALAATKSLDDAAQAAITKDCGGAPDPDDPSIITGLRRTIQAARIQADSRYFGLDVRADFGDLSLAGIDTVNGTSFFAGVGWGRRSVRNTEAATGIRAHLGARYWDNEGEDEGNMALEGGIAFEAIRFYNYQRLTLVGGLDGRYHADGVHDGEEETSINLRASLNVPVTPTASVSVNLAAPVHGERHGPILSIKANWRLLRSTSF